MNKDHSPGEISDQHLSRLLPIGLSKNRRPIDELLEYLEEFDRNDGTLTVLWDGAVGLDGLEKELTNVIPDLNRLKDLKAKAKTIIKSPSDRLSLLGSMLAYFLIIASSLVHHGQPLSSQSLKKLTEAFRELSLVTPDPWKGLLERATAIGAKPPHSS